MTTSRDLRDLNGLRVALLEARMEGELAALVRRYGGEPISVPAVKTVPPAESADVASAVAWLAETPRVVVLSTGAAVDALFAEADRLGCTAALHAGLAKARTIARGPKPAAALKARGLAAQVRVASPYTTADMLAALAPLPLAGAEVLVLHYGERNLPLLEGIARLGATARELLLYAWALPDDVAPLAALVDDVIAGNVPAIAFTSQVQARHLFDVAGDRQAALRDALATGTIVCAIGPTCERALRDLGVAPAVVPASPKLGPMVQALADFVAERDRRI